MIQSPRDRLSLSLFVSSLFLLFFFFFVIFFVFFFFLLFFGSYELWSTAAAVGARGSLDGCFSCMSPSAVSTLARRRPEEEPLPRRRALPPVSRCCFFFVASCHEKEGERKSERLCFLGSTRWPRQGYLKGGRVLLLLAGQAKVRRDPHLFCNKNNNKFK